MAKIKFFIFAAFLFAVHPINSQSVYGTISLGTERNEYIQATLQDTVAFAMYQVTYKTNLSTEHFMQVKWGFRIVNKKDVKVYLYMPSMNYSFEEKKYNNPFGAELFWKNFSLNFDVYKDKIVPSIKYNIKLLGK